MTRRVFTFIASLGLAISIILAPCAASSGEFVQGINFTHPLQLSMADQNAGLAQLKSAGVRVIRIGFFAPDADKGIDFIKRAYTQNIKVLLTFHSQYSPNAQPRPAQPKEFPGYWAAMPLSSIDLDLSRQYFQQLMDKLDTNGITLAGIELENEINHPGFNGEFSLPGEGKNFSFDDLNHDPEGQKIAKGYLQYLKVLAILKQIRDYSKLNRHTALISAGLSNTGPEGPWSKKVDAVGIGGTIKFLRAHGLDGLVDAYGIHTYPWKNGPGDKAEAIHRFRRMQQNDLSECVPAGSSNGKPCWITEWGFGNDSKSCPPDEKANSMLVEEMMNDFRQLAQERRLGGLIYYTWTGEAQFDVFRCGELTEPGKLAIQPLF